MKETAFPRIWITHAVNQLKANKRTKKCSKCTVYPDHCELLSWWNIAAVDIKLVASFLWALWCCYEVMKNNDLKWYFKILLYPFNSSICKYVTFWSGTFFWTWQVDFVLMKMKGKGCICTKIKIYQYCK